MRAANVVETLPTARPGDDVLSAVGMVSRHGLPGLVVADERGEVVGCMSSIDLLRLALPPYVRADPGLARVFDEEHADRIAAALAGTRVRDVVGEATDRIPMAPPQATVVELAELMARKCCPLVLVEKAEGGTLGIITVNRLLKLLVAAAEDAR
ncbi:MAG: CBS domain-containing protein [Actinomycetota bacterium]|nr:CBS domain-containing protein [Actinomycetota bacterium]